MYELEDIQTFKDENLEKMQISIDLRRRLSRNVKKFFLKLKQRSHQSKKNLQQSSANFSRLSASVTSILKDDSQTLLNVLAIACMQES